MSQETVHLQMIDEFTDVNDGEKALMKLWNGHVMKIKSVIVKPNQIDTNTEPFCFHSPYADRHIPLICRDFVLKYRQIIKERNLAGNLALHLANISDFHLITPLNVLECMQIVHGMRQQSSM